MKTVMGRVTSEFLQHLQPDTGAPLSCGHISAAPFFFSHAHDGANSDQPCHQRGSEIWTHRATSENARQPLQLDITSLVPPHAQDGANLDPPRRQ